MNQDHGPQTPDEDAAETHRSAAEDTTGADAAKLRDDGRFVLLSSERFIHLPLPRARPSAVVVPIRPR